MAQRRIIASLLLLALAPPAFGQAPAQAPARRSATPNAMPQPTESRIHILSATLGKSEINRVCDATKALTQQCEGLSRCRVTASNRLCETPPSPDPLIATLRVEYRCGPQDQPRAAAADRPLDVTIVCRRKTPVP